MEAWKDELYHHGIKGQVWGHRNGPPYPLGYSDHSAKQISLAKKNKDRSMESFKRDSQTSQKKSLTDAQKRAIKIGAAAVGAALAVTGGVVLAKQLQNISRGKDALFGSSDISIDDFEPFKRFSEKPSFEEVINNAVEQNNSLNLLSSKDHCEHIFVQMEAQEQGYDTKACSWIGHDGGRSFSDFMSCFKDADNNRIWPPTAAAINDHADSFFINRCKFENGQHGAITAGIKRRDGSVAPHMFRWDIENDKVKFTDGVNGRNAQKYIGRLSGYDDKEGHHEVQILRTDNLTLDLQKAKELGFIE